MISAIIKIKTAAEEITGFTLKLSEPLSFVPGKYVMLSFLDSPEVRRAFSVVAYDEKKKELLLVIKKTGDFTGRLFNSKTGDKLNLCGPYGRFVLPKADSPLVFIAGGIGITPLYSMMHGFQESGRKSNMYLYYSGKTAEKMALLDKIKKIKDKRIKIEISFTESGGKRLTVGDLRSDVKEFDDSVFYICGPLPMIEEMRSSLLAAKVDDARIRSEEFVTK